MSVPSKANVDQSDNPARPKAVGVSDAVMLSLLAEAIEADTTQARKYLSISNIIEALRDACIAKVNEINCRLEC